jgi:hypothetical protein
MMCSSIRKLDIVFPLIFHDDTIWIGIEQINYKSNIIILPRKYRKAFNMNQLVIFQKDKSS